ncbi:hypothetical protein KFU94_41835 [Chloroflexi bacterium TSY]|nr:hypothetical protein [Chloroflexi bacterium TSY]
MTPKSLQSRLKIAKNAKFGSTETTALLMGLTATHFAKYGAMVGLEYTIYFKRPVFADETISIEWLIIKTTPYKHTQGLIVDLRGRICNNAGITSVGAKGKVLVAEKL